MITFKKLIVSHSQSEETLAFVADVYSNGVFIGHAKNSGQGGCTHLNYYAERTPAYRKALDEATAFAQSKSWSFDGVNRPHESIEDYLDHLVGEEDDLKRQAAVLRRGMKTQVMFVVEKDGKRSCKQVRIQLKSMLPAEVKEGTRQFIAKVRSTFPEITVVLNELPLKDATKLFIAIMDEAENETATS